MQKILLVDAPAVLGWQRWREMDAKYGLGLIRQALSAAVAMGLLEKRDVDVLAHLLLGSLTEAAMVIARSPNPGKARKAAERALASMIEGWPRQVRRGGARSVNARPARTISNPNDGDVISVQCVCRRH